LTANLTANFQIPLYASSKASRAVHKIEWYTFMNVKNKAYLSAFASLRWYDETIKFIFDFVSKTSELLLAAGIVVSTANFLTDGDVMQGHPGLSEAWAWAQAIAIDASLGIVFTNAFQALRERDKIRAIIFFTQRSTRQLEPSRK
jgi:hypothetical protein